MDGTPAILEARDISKSFGGIQALNRCELTIGEGELVGVIGPNGSGKSTLFNILTGLLRADSGRARFGDTPLLGLTPERVARLGVGRTFQLTRVFPNLTVRQNLELVPGAEHAAERAAELLAFVEMEAFADRKAKMLSYGQQRLVEFARTLMLSPRLLLLDEPFAGINPTLQRRLCDHVVELNRRGMAVCLIDHNMALMRRLCSRVCVLHEGRLLMSGSMDEIEANTEVLDAYLGRRAR